ncbi:FAD-dependent oxidoreductase [Intestinibacillus massiliensis]|uniref:NAD(P)-binding protein n=1 Tax=Intestinibacillus massiliensis TaxID=1871029 RepID=UPI000B35FEC9|nr:NAD(P)-binding protein [Intestinibacillus massiliensis]MCB6364629.1 FAD-dependent oxidoreductase [Intestinibacillus massiliensis]
MSRLIIETPNRAQMVVEGLYRDLERRIIASPPGLCPVDMAASFLKLCHAQTCGKCVPCRIGLGQLAHMLEEVLDGNATMETIQRIEQTAQVIADSADCAIGFEAANMVLRGVRGFRDDYIEHVTNNRCNSGLTQPVPCVSMCPANVDIPGYIALIHEKRYADAVRLIRKDNPFPTACALVCEHPCEARCRRNMVDDAINICGLKRYAVEQAGEVPVPACAKPTGKRVAVIGGGPGGLTAAYFLSLMGHHVEVFEQRAQLGGMLRYGIPSYRLPREMLDRDIRAILSTGVTVHTNISIGRDRSFSEIEGAFDAVFICIGAHIDKKIGIEGEEGEGVLSAMEMLRENGDGQTRDLSGKRVCVIGGGNVSMDAARSAIRMGADSVSCVYRRRVEDMTALNEEIEEAAAEGCNIIPLQAPVRIELDGSGKVCALWTRPQMIGPVGADGRPRPVNAGEEDRRIPCDLVIVAIGQGIDSSAFAEAGVPTVRGAISALPDSLVKGHPHVFAGGDAVTGPSTVIRAIAAGKVAAANIDSYLGFRHVIDTGVSIPPARLTSVPACGRVNLGSRDFNESRQDFEQVAICMTHEEAMQESSRCLRCDHYGYGIFKGGRQAQW